MTNSAYPDWVCHDCASQVSPRFPAQATWHVGECGLCKQRKEVTEPRDYGYPDFRPVIEKLAKQNPHQ